VVTATPSGKNWRPARAKIISYPLDDELVLYDEQTREGFILNPSAAKIWELADGTRTVAGMARGLSRAYGVEYKAALDDVQQLLNDLNGAGLLAGS
jgi:hypothetical protein